MASNGMLPVLCILFMMLVAPLALVSMAGASDEDGEDRSETRATLTVRRFAERTVPVGVDFEDDMENATYHISLPRKGTVTSASMTIEGVQRYTYKGFPTDFADNPTAGHQAYYLDSGTHPPTKSLSQYTDYPFQPDDEDAIMYLDASNFSTSTPFNNPPPYHYPWHLFDMIVNITDMVRLQVDWHGYGMCAGNATFTHGTELWVWNYTALKWHMLDSYAVNDTGNPEHNLSVTLRNPYHFTSQYGHVQIIASGQRDEKGGGGWPDVGRVVTDYVSATVLKNDTLQSPSNVEVAIGDGAAFWSQTGDFTVEATLGSGSGFKTALQAFIDSAPPGPGRLNVPMTFRVDHTTRGMVRVTDLEVVVREPINQQPTFISAKNVSMTEDEDLHKGLDLWDHFDDDIQGPNLVYAVVFEENASAVTAVIDDDGHSVNFFVSAPDWAGTLGFRFNATDAWGLSAVSSDFMVTVTEVNDAPVIVDPGNQYLDEDIPFELNLTVLEPDLPYGDELTFSTDSDMFDIDVNTGRIAYTPLQDDVGSYDVTLTVMDRSNANDSIVVTFIITDINDAPVIDDPGEILAYEDAYFSYNFTTTDEDPGDLSTWQLVGGVGTMFMGTQNGHLTWIPTNEHVGEVNISIIARDKGGAASQLQITILVLNVNDPPELDDLHSAQLTEGERFVYTIAFRDDDTELDPGETHTFVVDPPLFEVESDGRIDFIPTNDDVGTYVLNITVRDTAGLSDKKTWEVDVANVNQPPTVEPLEDQRWTEDGAVYLTIVANDPDVGDRLTFSDTTSMFDIGTRTGIINFTPTQSNVGKHSLQIKVTDDSGISETLYFEVIIIALNDPPVVDIRVETLKDTLREGDPLSLAVDVTDEDTDRRDLYFTWTLDGDQVGTEDSITLRDLASGDHQVKLTVDDGDNVVTAVYPFHVEAEDVPFPWVGLIAGIVVLAIVAVLVVKVVLPLVSNKLLKGGDAKKPGNPGK